MTEKTKRKNDENKRILMILGSVIAAAIVVAIIFIVMSSQSSFSSGTADYSAIPQGRQPDGGFVVGDPDAPITIVAFEDFLCPHCQRYEATIGQFVNQYVATGLARFEYRFFPAVDPTYSELSAKYVECADILEPGSFLKAHDVMFDLVTAARFSNSTPRSFAERMDMSYTELLECTADADQVSADVRLGQQLGVTGTPTILVRFGNGAPQPTQFGQQPTFEQLGLLVASVQQ